MKEHTFTVRKPLSHMVTMRVTLKVTHEYRLRMWLGIWLLRVAAWVLGCNIRFGENDD